MDASILPYDVIMEIEDKIEDSRCIYMTCRKLYTTSKDRHYWESRGIGRIRNHLVKIPTELGLEIFALNGNLQMILHLFPTNLYTIDNYGDKLLKAACCRGHLDIIKYLHQVGVDVTSDRSAAILRATINGRLDAVKYLHEAGANITSVIITYADMYHREDVLKYLTSEIKKKLKSQ